MDEQEERQPETTDEADPLRKQLIDAAAQVFAEKRVILNHQQAGRKVGNSIHSRMIRIIITAFQLFR